MAAALLLIGAVLLVGSIAVISLPAAGAVLGALLLAAGTDLSRS